MLQATKHLLIKQFVLVCTHIETHTHQNPNIMTITWICFFVWLSVSLSVCVCHTQRHIDMMLQFVYKPYSNIYANVCHHLHVNEKLIINPLKMPTTIPATTTTTPTITQLYYTPPNNSEIHKQVVTSHTHTYMHIYIPGYKFILVTH